MQLYYTEERFKTISLCYGIIQNALLEVSGFLPTTQAKMDMHSKCMHHCTHLLTYYFVYWSCVGGMSSWAAEVWTHELWVWALREPLCVSLRGGHLTLTSSLHPGLQMGFHINNIVNCILARLEKGDGHLWVILKSVFTQFTLTLLFYHLYLL